MQTEYKIYEGKDYIDSVFYSSQVDQWQVEKDLYNDYGQHVTIEAQKPKAQHQDIQRFILKSIDFEGLGYDRPSSTNKEKVALARECFLSEYGHNVSRYGKVGAMKEYIQGLPSWLSIPYYNGEIEELYEQWGFNTEDCIDHYWHNMATILVKLLGV